MATKAAKKAPTKRAARARKTSAQSAPVKKPSARRTARNTTAKGDERSPSEAPSSGVSASRTAQDKSVPGFELDVRIADVEPEIWRRLWVPVSAELCDVHLALQLAFDWENSHRHQFSIGVRSFAPEGTADALDYDGLRLADVVEPGTKLVYEYDFGDGWEHIIRVLGHVEIPGDEPRFRCVDGARRGPVEDSGGPAGYMMLLDDLADPSSEQHEDAVQLAGADFDEEQFDLAQTNGALAELDRRLQAMEVDPAFGTTTEPLGERELVLMFETGDGRESRMVQLPDVILHADAAMLEKLASFFDAAARAVREHGRATPDIYLSDFLRDDAEGADIIVTQDAPEAHASR